MLKHMGTPQLLVALALLLGGGLVMVYSASAVRSDVYYGVTWAYLLRQLGALGIGAIAFVALQRVPLPWLERLAYLGWAIGVLMIAATLTPLGVEVNGARRWLTLGSLRFQPLEPAKLAVILGVARWLASHKNRMDDVRFSLVVPGLMAGLLEGNSRRKFQTPCIGRPHEQPISREHVVQ